MILGGDSQGTHVMGVDGALNGLDPCLYLALLGAHLHLAHLYDGWVHTWEGGEIMRHPKRLRKLNKRLRRLKGNERTYGE